MPGSAAAIRIGRIRAIVFTICEQQPITGWTSPHSLRFHQPRTAVISTLAPNGVSDGNVRIWDIEVPHSMGSAPRVSCAAGLRGRKLLATCGDFNVYVWNTGRNVAGAVPYLRGHQGDHGSRFQYSSNDFHELGRDDWIWIRRATQVIGRSYLPDLGLTPFISRVE